MTDELTLQDLVTQSGINIRTIRYYMQEGLLQAPDTRGKYAHYSQYHVERLKMIQYLKGLHLPLQQIRNLLDSLTSEEILQLTQYQEIPSPTGSERKTAESTLNEDKTTGSDALEYIRNLQRAQENIRATTSNYSASAPTSSPLRSLNQKKSLIKNMSNMAGSKETWSRVVIGAGIELLLREPMDPDTELKTRELIEHARRLFKEKK